MAVYLLLGDDEERKTRGIERLRRERQSETFDASETSPEAVVSACNSFTLFGEDTFVLLKNLDAWNAAQKAKVVDYLNDPAEATDLVLSGTKLGAKERLLAAVQKSGEVHKFDQPKGKELARWATSQAKKLGFVLPPEVAGEVVQRCLSDKMRVARELEKLSLYVGATEATMEDVDVMCPPDVQSNIFAFVDALAAGKERLATEALSRLFATGEPPLRILFMIRRQFVQVSRAKVLLERGVPRSEVAKDVNVPPFKARDMEDQARNLSTLDLERALSLILDLERGLKGGSHLPERTQMEVAVSRLSGGVT